MIHFADPYLYTKGTCNVLVSDPATGNIEYQSSKVQTNQLTTSVDTGAIRAGLGNGIAIQLASDATVDLTLTAADFDLDALGMQVGSTPFYGAPAPVCESVKAEGTTIYISGEAAAPQGHKRAIAYVSTPYGTNTAGIAGKARGVGEDGEIQSFSAVPGETYLVWYWTKRTNARQLTVYGAFTPGIKHVTAQLAVYSMEGANRGKRGYQIGWLYFIIPRMQFSGSVTVSGSQTEPYVTELSGTALTYEEAASDGTCVDWRMPKPAYMIYVPFETKNTVQGIAVIGGTVVVPANTEQQIPVKLYMSDGSLVQPDFSALTFTAAGAPEGTTVGEHTGVISAGDADGRFTVTVTLTEDPSIQTVVHAAVIYVGRGIAINGEYVLRPDKNVVINNVFTILPEAVIVVNDRYLPADDPDAYEKFYMENFYGGANG